MENKKHTADKELRVYEIPVELRAIKEGSRTIEGYACKFNVLSKNLGGFCEKIDPKAFDNLDLTEQDIVVLFNHNENLIVARSNKTVSTLTLKVDETGLYFKMDAPNTTVGNDLYENVRLGNVQHCSFAFAVKVDKWEKDDTAGQIRTILEFSKIYDISPVVNPAYLDTEIDIAKRSLENFEKQSENNTPDYKISSTSRKRKLSMASHSGRGL